MYRLRMESCLLLGAALLAACSDPNTPTVSSGGLLAAKSGSFGAVQVTNATIGGSRDPDGYTVALVGSGSQALAVNGSVTFSKLKAGNYTVALSGVATNCTLMNPNPATVTVTAGATVQTAFQISCAAPLRPLAFTRETPGADPFGRDAPTDIYAMNADGSGVVRLTYNAADYRLRDFYPAWSPDGARVAFWSTRDGEWEVWAMNADGTGVTRLTNSPRLLYAVPIVWSPDGRKMAFQTGYGDEIYVLKADGSSLVDVTNNPAADGGPVWSPDGSKIAFWTNRDGNSEIYVINADGSNPVNLTNNPAADGAPAWSPDGQKIAFETDRDGKFAIYLMNADGSGEASRLISTQADDRGPVWSRDGTKIAFQAGGDICVANGDGSNPINITNNPGSNRSIVWSPDGVRIAFQTRVDVSNYYEIWVVNADGSNLRPIAQSPYWNNWSPAWRPR